MSRKRSIQEILGSLCGHGNFPALSYIRRKIAFFGNLPGFRIGSVFSALDEIFHKSLGPSERLFQ